MNLPAVRNVERKTKVMIEYVEMEDGGRVNVVQNRSDGEILVGANMDYVDCMYLAPDTSEALIVEVAQILHRLNGIMLGQDCIAEDESDMDTGW